ncbi:M28 protein [Murid betaherpesvirus 1]|nr:M28 protein [Murid betaherpesvirus 1]
MSLETVGMRVISDDDLDEVFFRDDEQGESPADADAGETTTAVAPSEVPVDPAPTPPTPPIPPVAAFSAMVIEPSAVAPTSIASKMPVVPMNIVTGTAQRVDLESGGRATGVDNFHARGELLRCARACNVSSFDEVKAFVKRNSGRRFGLDHMSDITLRIGDAATTCPTFDVEKLLGYRCSERSSEMTVVGRIVFGARSHGDLIAVYTGGDRCYVHSQDTDLLYIVSERGLVDLLSREGHRHIYEMFDAPPATSDDVEVPSCLVPLAELRDLDSVECFVRDRTGLSTFRQANNLRFMGEFFGYFMVGDEESLRLDQLVPGRVFFYLRRAGYRVIGRSEMQFIVLCNEKLEVFVLLGGGRVLKVANTIAGFLRDRLRLNLQPYRRVFARNGVAERTVCVGQVLTFYCEVDYVVPGGADFAKWLALRTPSGIAETCVPTLG